MESEGTVKSQHWQSLIPVVGEQVLVIQVPPSDQAELGLSGRDVECAVVGLNPLWPLLLPGGWRLCHSSQYYLEARTVLQREGKVVTVDAVDDPWGIGKDAVKSTELLSRRAFAAPTWTPLGRSRKRQRRRKG